MFAIYDDNILPRLIMIIIKIIILYFIRIRHTGDFPSTGIPASHYNNRSQNYCKQIIFGCDSVTDIGPIRSFIS